MRHVHFLASLLVLLLLLPSIMAGTPLFINSHDWRDAVLLSLTAYEENLTPFTLTSLGDAQIKLQSLPRGSRIILYESASPVVKNLEKTLRVNGFQVETHTYTDYRDLQENLPVKDTVFIVHPAFSTEALTLIPLALWENASIRFAEHATREYKGRDVQIIAGEYAARDVQRFAVYYPTATFYTGWPIDNAYALSNLTSRVLPGEWMLYMHPAAVDVHPFPLEKPVPILLSLGYLDEEAGVILGSNRTRIEIISPMLADTAKALERVSGRDLKLIVKYGRTVTNLPGLEGKILPLDTIRTDYPFIQLKLVDVLVNPVARTLTLRIANNGTIPALVYTTIQYAADSHADEHPWIILPGEVASIVHPLDTLPADALSLEEGADAGRVTLTIRYDYREPLRKTYTEGGKSILIREARAYPDEPLNVSVTNIRYESWRDELVITLHNPTRREIMVDLSIPALNISSYPVLAKPLGDTHVRIPTPNLLPEDMPETIQVIVNYGHEKPTLLTIESASIRFARKPVSPIILGVIIVIILLLIIWRWTRKRENT